MRRPTAVRAEVRAKGSRRLRQKLADFEVVREGGVAEWDVVAVEEPLEIRLAGETVAVIMRTPGEDHRLALGYLHGEGVIASAADATSVFHCGRPGDEGYGNVIDVIPASGARIDYGKLETAKRASTTSSACGVCGRLAVEDLMEGIPPLQDGIRVAPERLFGAIEALRRHQPAFDETGGTHAAALWSAEGTLIAAHEDVGRHNAVDKVVGSLLLARNEGVTAQPVLLTVSGRAGFEIIQKVARARIPIVASVSAPTSLAVELARASGVTLAGFVRGTRMNVYARAERISAGS